jgi:hypothetical protein
MQLWIDALALSWHEHAYGIDGSQLYSDGTTPGP